MTFTDSSDLEPTTFASGIEDGQTDVTGPVDAAEVERILAEQYGIEITPTLPTDTSPPADGAPVPTDPVESTEPAAPQDDGSRPGPSAEGEASIPSPSAPSRVDPDTGVPIESPMDRIVADAPEPDGDVIIVEGPTPGVDAPAEPAPQTPPPAPANDTPPSFSADEFLAAVFGTVDEQLVRGTADMAQRYQQLPPAYREIVDDLFAGRVPAALAQPQPTYTQPAPSPAPAPAPTAPTPASPYDPWLDDAPAQQPATPVQPVVDPALAAQIEQARREIEDLRAVEAARIQREVVAAADAAVESIRSRYPELSEAEIAGVAYAVNQSGYVTNGLAQGYDPRQVWEQTAEQLIWTNPSLRPKAIASQVQLPATAVPRATPIPERDEAAEAERRAKAAAVSGGSGVAQSPLTSITPPGEFKPPVDAAGRRGWSVDDIAEALKGITSDT